MTVTIISIKQGWHNGEDIESICDRITSYSFGNVPSMCVYV